MNTATIRFFYRAVELGVVPFRVWVKLWVVPEVFGRVHVEYAERGTEYGILFIFSLFCEYIHLEYIRIHVIYRVNQAEHGIPILVIAPQECVKIDSTGRVGRGTRERLSNSIHPSIYLSIRMVIQLYIQKRCAHLLELGLARGSVCFEGRRYKRASPRRGQ